MNTITLKEEKLPAGLYLVATPLGNLRDITLRALDTLASCDGIACEDTRISSRLLAHYGIQKPLYSYHDHNGDHKRPQLIRAIEEGKAIALISDAGSPLIADPGYKLIKELSERSLFATTLPGPSSVIAGLQLSGLPSDQFFFAGFPPPKQGAKERFFQDLKSCSGSLVFFESARRLKATLETVQHVLGNRPCAVVREITKIYEEKRGGTVQELLDFYTKEGPPKGEIVVVLGEGEAQTQSTEQIEFLLKEALRVYRVKDAVNVVSSQTGLSKKELYQQAIRLKQENS